jgi:hypothetical protein
LYKYYNLIKMLSVIGSTHPGASPSIIMQAGQQLQEEWMGQTSSKFRVGNKMHVQEPKFKEQKHPLF